MLKLINCHKKITTSLPNPGVDFGENRDPSIFAKTDKFEAKHYKKFLQIKLYFKMYAYIQNLSFNHFYAKIASYQS